MEHLEAMFAVIRKRAIVLRARSARLRHQTGTTRLRSRTLCGDARDVLLEAVMVNRRRLAGGSDVPDTALRSFARDVARELTPPLTTLWNRIEVMLVERQSDQSRPDMLGDLETLRRHAAQLAVTVKALRCMSGEDVLELRPIDLNRLVEDSLAPVVPRLARQAVDVKLLLDRTIPPVLGDSDALRYALTALVETTAETLRTVAVTTRSGGECDVRISVGTGRESESVRDILPRDALRLGLVDAIVRSLRGRIERRDGNPGPTFVISLQAVGAA